MTTIPAHPCVTCDHPPADHSPLVGCTARADRAWCDCPTYAGPAPTALPVLPYDGGTSSGSSGTDTSAARAQREDANGTTKARQRQALTLVASKGAEGITVKDLRAITGWHHGQASGALSNLHHAGIIARLATTRDRCKVYVVPAMVADRITEPHGVRTPRGQVKRGQITLTVAEADALRRTLNRLGNPANPVHGLGVTFTDDLAAVCTALTARDDKPARRGA